MAHLGTQVSGAFMDEMVCVFANGHGRLYRIVQFLRAIPARNPVILQPGSHAHAGACGMRRQVSPFRRVRQIGMELPISRIAGITAVATPNLSCTRGITSEGCQTGWGDDRSEHTMGGWRLGHQQPVRLDDEPPKPGREQFGLDGRRIGAFRQPDSTGSDAEVTPVLVDGHPDLPFQRTGSIGQQRQQRMRRRARQQLKSSRLRVARPTTQKVPMLPRPRLPNLRQPHPVMLRHPRPLRLQQVPVQLLLGQCLHPRQMLFEALLQQGVREHRRQRWRNRQVDHPHHTIALPAIQHPQQRHVALDDCFEEPAFLQEIGVLRMPHKGQVRVQQQR